MFGEQDTGLTHRDDDKNRRSGLFYINREDPTLLALISLIFILRFDG